MTRDGEDHDGADGPDAPAVDRLGRHAIGLLEAAHAFGDPALIAQAEAVARAVGFALAGEIGRLPEPDGGV